MSGLNGMRVRFLRFAFHHFYNAFAGSYDTVSTLVSLGHWRAWTNAAIPHVRGPRVLEIAFGTGNLLIDQYAAGLSPFGIDLSANMVRIAACKLRRAGRAVRLVRGSVLALPFAGGSLDTLVLTFPPNFLASSQALAEMRRVLVVGGRIVLVEGGWLQGPPIVGALLNLAFRFTGTADERADRSAPLRAAGFQIESVRVGDAHSHALVVIATNTT